MTDETKPEEKPQPNQPPPQWRIGIAARKDAPGFALLQLYLGEEFVTEFALNLDAAKKFTQGLRQAVEAYPTSKIILPHNGRLM
jgi:hypothetical protein